MSAELIGIWTVGIGLATLIATIAISLAVWIKGLYSRLSNVEKQVSRFEGLMEGAGVFPRQSPSNFTPQQLQEAMQQFSSRWKQ